MKNKLIALTLSLAMAAVCLVGCGSSDSAESDTASTQEATAESADTEAAAQTDEIAGGYAFEANGVTLLPDMDIDTVLDQLGDANSVFESESCARQGTAYLYNYGDYEIETYPDGDVNRIYYISLLTDMVSTPEGVDLSMTKDDVIAKLGEPTETTDNALIYQKDGSDSKLKFIFEDDETMVSIEYDSKEM